MPVLYIKDKNGNFVSIPSIKGADGKSAYQQAVDGGYTGTEEEFIAVLNGFTVSEAGDHFSNFSNPHKVTASQVGALPTTGGVMTGSVQWNDGKTGIIGQSDGNVVIRNYKLTESGNDDVLSFHNTELLQNLLRVYRNGVPYSIYGQHNKPSSADIGAIPSTIEESDRIQRICTGNHNYIRREFDADVPEMPAVSNFTHYVTLGVDNKVYAVLSLPVDYTGKAFYYTAHDNLWHEIADTEKTVKIQTGSYGGGNKAGPSNQSAMTFNFPPKLLFISDTDNTLGIFVGGSPRYTTMTNSTVTNRVTVQRGFCSFNGNTVTWHSNNSSLDQLDYAGATYHYVAIG